MYQALSSGCWTTNALSAAAAAISHAWLVHDHWPDPVVLHMPESAATAVPRPNMLGDVDKL